jgi:hypothetical protein
MQFEDLLQEEWYKIPTDLATQAEMIHGCITAGDTTVVSTAAVLYVLPHQYFSWTVSFRKFGRNYGPVVRQSTA